MTFHSSTTKYLYENVTKAEIIEWQKAESVGKWFCTNIKDVKPTWKKIK